MAVDPVNNTSPKADSPDEGETPPKADDAPKEGDAPEESRPPHVHEMTPEEAKKYYEENPTGVSYPEGKHEPIETETPGGD